MDGDGYQLVITIAGLQLCNSLSSCRTEDATLPREVFNQHIALNSSCRDFNKTIVRCNRIAACQKGYGSQKKDI